MNDRYEDLEKIFVKKIEKIKTSNYDELLKICEQEYIDPEDMNEEELRKALIDYFSDEIEE